MELTLCIILTFLSVFILSLLLLVVPAAEKRQVSKSLEQLEAYDMKAPTVSHVESIPRPELPALPFANRVVQPSVEWILNLAKRMTPKGVIDQTNRQLKLAGNPHDLDVDKFLTLKALSSLVIFAVLILLAVLSIFPKSRLILFGLFLVPCGFFIPDIWLRHRVEKRQKEIGLALPDTLDLLTISVEAGLGFDAALTKVIKNSSGPLAQEFSKMLSECQAGADRKDALRNMANRTTVPEVLVFVTAIIQADIFGISISKVLRTQAREMRVKRRQKAEEIAMKTPVKIVFPLVLCILPATLIVILGPAGIRIASSLLPFFGSR